MAPRKRKSKAPQLQFAPAEFKVKVAKKLHAYHLFIQLGFIAQGIMQYLSIFHYQNVWSSFGAWLRTIRDVTLPSEKVVATALTRTYMQFIIDDSNASIFKKFLRKRIHITQLEGCNVTQQKAA